MEFRLRYLFSKKVGFTLIELMIVVSIIGILAVIAVPQFADLLRKSKEGATKGGLGTMRSVMSMYYADMEGQYPYDMASFTINGKYLTVLPVCSVPPYHADTTAPYPAYPDNNGNMYTYGVEETALGNDAIATSLQYTENPASTHKTSFTTTQGDCENVGSQIYCDSTYLGVIWVSCSHTDTRGTIWSNY